MHRFYIDNINEPQTILTGTEAHHLSAVMRLDTHEQIELFDGRGALAIATITKASNRKVTLEVNNIELHDKSKKQNIAIATSIAKGERFDWLIAKCTELGVNRIIPAIFERTVKQPKNHKIIGRWNNIAISSCKQCKRLFLPAIEKPISLDEVLNDNENQLLLIGSLDKNAHPLIKMDFHNNDIVAFVGPEGGLTDDEIKLLLDNNAKPVKLTDTVLRIETAAVAFASILTARRDAI